jgi:hypothetical protein
MASKWLKGCEICNAGLVAEMDRLVDSGISVNKAAGILAKEGQRKIGDLVYSQAAIRARYLLHKGQREPNRKVVHYEQPQPPQTFTSQSSTPTPILKNEKRQPQQEQVSPEVEALSVDYHMESAKASANARKPKLSELEKAAATIEKAAMLLEAIVEGRLKDNGSEYDKLAAASIRRHLPGIIMSSYQLGIDPQKAINFYKGGRTNLSERRQL